jgi:hypothetical protein
MDSGRTEDLQQYMSEIKSLQEELRSGREQQHQNGADVHGAGTTNNSAPAEVYRVAVRLPPFGAELPAVWFAQAEAQFTLAGVTSEKTKFYHVIYQLDHRYASQVEDIISPPERDPYTKLRTELVRRLPPRKSNASASSLRSKRATANRPSFSNTSGA